MKLKSNKGITLVALVITIVVLLILAGVTIGTLESNGVIGKAKVARTETANAEGNEISTLDRYLSYIEEKTGNGEEKEEMVPGATFEDGETLVTLSWEDLQKEENITKYGYRYAYIKVTEIKDGYIDGVGKDTQETGAFSFSPLKSIILPSTMTKIGNYAFLACESLESITIPVSVTTIGDVAFGCTGLKTITIPESVTSIGERAFQECESLTSVTYKGTAFTSKSAFISAFTCNGGTIGENIFSKTGISE